MEITNADMIRYYLAYKDYEENLLNEIGKGDIEAFRKYLVGMRVIRNFKKGSSGKVYDVSKEFTCSSNPFDADALSKKLLESKLLQKRINNAVVAASKIIWAFKYKFKKAIIMDNLAKDYLAKVTNKKIEDYKNFCEIWEEEYKVFKSSYLKQIEKINIKELKELSKEDWFIRRTFDNYLWARGKKDSDKNESH